MADKINDMPRGMWEPVRISASNMTVFRAFILLMLGLVTLTGITAADFLVASVSACCFVIMACVFAVKHVFDYEYRGHYDFLLTSKMTVEALLEIKHQFGEHGASSVIRKLQTQENPGPIWVRLQDYQRLKRENQNIAIFGMNGCGKTMLLKCLAREISTSFKVKVLDNKRKDRGTFEGLGFKRIDMRENRPNPWSSKEAFKRALLVAINLDETRGITANAVRTLLDELLDKANTWDELFVELKLAISGAKSGTIRSEALLHVQQMLRAIYDPKASYFEVSNTSEFLDYSNVGETRGKFDEELQLDIIYEMIVDGKLSNTVIILDEAHRLLANKFTNGKNVSIVERLIAREIRATGSRIWLCTQLYTDVSPETRDQFAAQYMFKTKDPQTLQSLRMISQLLDQAVADLDPYNFVDIGQDFHEKKVRDAVFHFKLYPRAVDEPVSASYLQVDSGNVEGTPSEPAQQDPGASSSSVPPAREVPLPPSRGHLMEVVNLLEKEAMFTKEIAKEIAKQRHEQEQGDEEAEPSEEEVRAVKLELTDQKVFLTLVSLHDCRFAGVLVVQDRYREKPQSLYYLKNKGEYRVHTKLMTLTRKILAEKQKTVLYEGKNHMPASEVDFVIDGFIIEVETSLKRGNTRDLEARIAKANKRVLIVVPNDKTKQKYMRFLQTGKVDVVVFYELGYFLDHSVPTPTGDLNWADSKRGLTE